jgi:hypothetical protein
MIYHPEIGVPGLPIPLPGGLGDDPLIQKLVPDPFYPFHHGTLPYLAGGLLPVKTGKVEGFKGGKFHPLPGIPLGGSVGEVMTGGIDPLLMGRHRPFSYFDP